MIMGWRRWERRGLDCFFFFFLFDDQMCMLAWRLFVLFGGYLSDIHVMSLRGLLYGMSKRGHPSINLSNLGSRL